MLRVRRYRITLSDDDLLAVDDIYTLVKSADSSLVCVLQENRSADGADIDPATSVCDDGGDDVCTAG